MAMSQRYCDSLKDLTYPEQFLYDVLGVEKDKAGRSCCLSVGETTKVFVKTSRKELPRKIGMKVMKVLVSHV